MIYTAIVLGISIIFLITQLLKFIKRKDWDDVIFLSVFSFPLIVFEIALILGIINVQYEPTAIDVYRGLTELEVTSVNGVPKDTVVVFKNR